MKSILWFPLFHSSRAAPRRMIPHLWEWYIAVISPPLAPSRSPLIARLVFLTLELFASPFFRCRISFSLVKLCYVLVSAIVSILAGPLPLRRFCFLLSFRSSFLSGFRFVLPLRVGPGFGWIVSSFLATIVARCPLEMSGPGGPSPLWDLKRVCSRLVHSPYSSIREVVFCPLVGGRAFFFRFPCVFFAAKDLTPCAAHLRQLGDDTLGKKF